MKILLICCLFLSLIACSNNGKYEDEGDTNGNYGNYEDEDDIKVISGYEDDKKAETNQKKSKDTASEKFYTLVIHSIGIPLHSVIVTGNNKKIELSSVLRDCILLSSSDFKSLEILVRDSPGSELVRCSNSESQTYTKKVDNYALILQGIDEGSGINWKYSMGIQTKQLPDKSLCKTLE